jgi:hypothetical protein
LLRQIPASTLLTQQVSCPSGKSALGGGFQLVSTLTVGQRLEVDPLQSFPSSDTSWTVAIANRNTFQVEVALWVVCAFAS